ncbi:MAG: type II secretion system secretin GspD [Pseudomonadota bacterium]
MPMKRSISLLTSAALIAGCATPMQRPSTMGELLTPVSDAPAAQAPMSGAPHASVPDGSRPQDRLYPGNDKVIDLPKVRRAPSARGGEGVMLNFEKAPLADVVHTILGDVLKKPYSIDAGIKGEVILHTTQPVPLDDLPGVLDTLLQANGAAMKTDAGGVIHIGSSDTLKGIPPLLGKGSGQPGQSISIVPLSHVGAKEMAELLKPVAPADAFLKIDTTRNLLVLLGSASQTQAWLDLIKSFDVDFMSGMSVGIFPLEYADAKETAKAIDLLLAKPDSATDGIVRVMPIEKLNTLFVVTPRKHYLGQIRDWVTRLDQAPDNALEPQLYVYPVQNGSASHLGKVLGGLFGKGSQTTDSSRGSLAPGLSGATLSSGSANGTSSTSTTGASSSTLGGGTSGGSTSNTALGSSLTSGVTSATNQQATVSAIGLEGNVRVVADEENNALLIYAPRREYRRIESALRQLDVAPVQVLIEASIVEVSLTDKFQFGLQWYFTNGFKGDLYGKRGEGGFNNGTSSDLASVLPGFNYTVSDSTGSIRAVLNALSGETSLKVVSSPSMLVLDNQPAEIRVGNQQPILSATTTTTGGNVTQSITYKDTGVMLKVVPRVNAGSLVTMDIAQEVTDVGSIDTATKQRSFLQRSMQSRIAVQSGQTAVLGGLIRDNNSNDRTGLPGLSRIPGLGYLFGSTEESKERTELIVMLTPRVMENTSQLRQVSDEIRTRLVDISFPALQGKPAQIKDDRAPTTP